MTWKGVGSGLFPWLSNMYPVYYPLFGFCHCAACAEAALQTGLDRRESPPPRDLPTKFVKYRRMRERQHLSNTLNFDGEHADRCNSKKCAGTQTPFTSFTADPYAHAQQAYAQHQGEERYILNLDRTTPSPPTAVAPRVPMNPMSFNPNSHGLVLKPEDDNMPLNLTVSSSSVTSSSGTGLTPSSSPLSNHGQQLRPSVITCAPPLPNNGMKYPSPPVGGHTANSMPNCDYRVSRREITTVDVCDPVIEEHFRRSLGKNYPEYLSKNSTNEISTTVCAEAQTPMEESHSPDDAMSVAGTVDDHFAKSLGETTWTRIKAQTDLDLFAGTVDEHFAKALGDTWFKIKAEKEGSVTPLSHSARASPSVSGQPSSRQPPTPVHT